MRSVRPLASASVSVNKRNELEMNEDLETEQAADDRPRSRRIVLMLLAYSAILGIIICFLPEEDTPLDFIVGIPLVILGVAWCFEDAQRRGHRIGRTMGPVLILFFMVGFPIYLLQTRGFGAFKSLGMALFLVGLMFTCMVAAAIATTYIGDASGLWDIPE